MIQDKYQARKKKTPPWKLPLWIVWYPKTGFKVQKVAGGVGHFVLLYVLCTRWEETRGGGERDGGRWGGGRCVQGMNGVLSMWKKSANPAFNSSRLYIFVASIKSINCPAPITSPIFFLLASPRSPKSDSFFFFLFVYMMELFFFFFFLNIHICTVHTDICFFFLVT